MLLRRSYARFVWGFTRPFLLVRRLREEPVAWRAFRWTVGVQVALTLALGSAYTAATWDSGQHEDMLADLAEARRDLEEARGEVARVPPGEGPLREELLAEVAERVTEEEKTVAKLARALEQAAAQPWWLTWWAKLAIWASSLWGAQVLVLGLSRDYQDRLARDLALVAVVQPEEAPANPRVRLDLAWLRRKLRRRLRGLWMTTASVMALSPLLLVGAPWGRAGALSSLLAAVTTAYWWLVFTAAKSARAWRAEDDPTPPAPVRALLRLTELPLLRWFGPRWMAHFARWATKSMSAPARAIEPDFAAFAGLGAANALASLPVVRIALRAAIVVVAAELLERATDSEDAHAGPSRASGPRDLAPELLSRREAGTSPP